MSIELLKTPLHSWHESHGGRMVEFAGWSMPVQYASIIEEHQATRQAASLFDVSHMGRFDFTGAGAAQFLDHLTTRRVADLTAGKIRYSLMCRDDGGILDDILVYRLSLLSDPSAFSMVVNAGNREKIAAWIKDQLKSFAGGAVEFQDNTLKSAMIAVQGPRANSIAAELFELDPASLGYFSGAVAHLNGSPCIVSRTGYTGEDGCELIVSAEQAESIWSRLMEIGQSAGIQAAGLGARDTLRLEAAMPLYGHELSEQINPAQTNLGFAINLKDREFVGRAAIVAAKSRDDLPVRIGFEMDGRRAAREESQIFVGDHSVGEVTSGTFSPTLQRPIGMAYVDPSVAEPGTEVEIDIRGKRHAARVVALPFYKRP